MSTLAHVFEAAGLSTVALGSQRRQIEHTAPPRGLWCDFPLGRPLGKPADAAFQHEVLKAAFGLLDADGPVFAVFDEAIVDDGTTTLSCTLPPADNSDDHPAVAEAKGLRPAYDRAVEQFGSRVGPSRTVEIDDIAVAIEAFARVADGTPWKEAGIPGVPARVAQDIRGYYETAALALADHTPQAWEASRWYHHQTEAGRTVLAAKAAMKESGAKVPVWFYLAPGDED